MNNYTKTIEGRLRSLGFCVLAISLVLLWKMFDLEVINHDHYAALAEEQQRFEKTEMAERGRIYVHDSAVDPNSYYPLAFDVKKFAVWIVPNHVKDKRKTAEELSTLLSLPEEEVFNEINNDKLYIPPVKRGLSLDEANNLASKNIPGLYIMPEYSRNYPEGSLASQVLGFVNFDGDGKYGFEGHYNNELKGKEGNVLGEKDTLGRIISLLDQKDPQNGNSYVLTIDRSIQYFVEKKLTEAIQTYQVESGSVVVMDVKTGGILAMSSLPSYDPNNYREQAVTDASIFMNPAISYLFEPGSVFKPIVMSAAIDAGAVTPETEEIFSNFVKVGNYEIHTAEDKAFGKENMTQILENSDNVGMVWVSEKLGKDAMYKYIKNFNLFDRTGIDLDTEVPGRAPDFKQWQEINRATIAFGQGISMTPIELVAAYAAIANGGKYIYPHIVDKVIMSDGTEKKVEKQEGEQIISQQTSESIRQMLYAVVEAGHAKKAAVPGFKVGAKTGTAQIPKPEGGYEDNDSKLGIYNHSVAGIVPIDDPQFVMLVKLTKPKTARYAESTAAPLFGDIANFLLNYHYRLQPTQ